MENEKDSWTTELICMAILAVPWVFSFYRWEIIIGGWLGVVAVFGLLLWTFGRGNVILSFILAFNMSALAFAISIIVKFKAG